MWDTLRQPRIHKGTGLLSWHKMATLNYRIPIAGQVDSLGSVTYTPFWIPFSTVTVSKFDPMPYK